MRKYLILSILINSMSSNLAQLPTDPTGGGSIGGAVQMTAVEQDNVINNLQRQINNQAPSTQSNMQENSTINLSQSTISELVTGLQKASNNGNTGLSTRDIPVNESRVAADEKIVPDYIPPVEEDDYVEHDQDNENIIQEYENTENTYKTAENIYEELQAPIVVAIIFLLFQLPGFRRFIKKIIPGVYNADGQLNVFGYIFYSITAAIFVFLSKRLVNAM